MQLFRLKWLSIVSGSRRYITTWPSAPPSVATVHQQETVAGSTGGNCTSVWHCAPQRSDPRSQFHLRSTFDSFSKIERAGICKFVAQRLSVLTLSQSKLVNCSFENERKSASFIACKKNATNRRTLWLRLPVNSKNLSTRSDPPPPRLALRQPSE